MRIPLPIVLLALALAGCQKADRTVNSFGAKAGRYVGVGIYMPGQMWTQLVLANAPADPAQATLSDDEQIIVLLDSATGELRQCGNLSGHCIGLNPWAKPLPSGQGVPAKVLEHARALTDQAEAKAAPPAPLR